MAILPMEGCDSERDGSPSELVKRRYRRFASGGAGLLWYEACAVVNEGRANPLQMHINMNNVGAFAKLLRESNQAAADACGSSHIPVNILQLTHSGRYSRPVDKPAPIVPQHDPLLDPRVGLAPDAPVVTDTYLDELVEKYVQAALLAREAGFDGVDIKACHRYLVSELLASHTREGKYGGSFENRTRFLLTVINEVRKAVGDDLVIATRFSVFDAHPYPYGWGVDREDCWQSDLTEPLRLVKLLVENGIDLLSNSSGNPYYRFPQVTRPLDSTIIGGEIPDEHPLESVARLFEFSRKIQKVAGEIPVIGNGYSWLRQFLPYAGAANLEENGCRMVGIGREAFAYPDAPKDIFTTGAMAANKCCIACSKCTQIMRDHGRTGCVIRDGQVYLPLYNEAREAAGHK
jgi:2,4-dienoyl-CoA reductase-like NADH-dependent reductase (Old Yellow Enzyme family)